MGLDRVDQAKPVRWVLNYGLGVDSTPILLRWIYEPETRPCPLSELLVITSMTGDEWPMSGQLVTDHVLPLLRKHGIRYVQVARSARNKGTAQALHAGGLIDRGDNVTVLSDTRSPTKVFLDGDYKLSEEMISNGTVPQAGGIRKCSMHAKGEIIDAWLETELDGAPFIQVIGFEVNERGRAIRDAAYNTCQRTGQYPLVEWGWDREQCEAYIMQKTGVKWIKSACTFCVFALANKAGVERVKPMFVAEPAAGIQALVMEYISVCLNPLQGLVKSEVKDGIITKRGRLANLLAGTGQHGAVLESFQAELDQLAWRVYEVQRVAVPTRQDPTKGVWSRSVCSVAEGTRAEMENDLQELAAAEGTLASRDEDGVFRVYLARRGRTFPAYERMYVVAPAGVSDKETKAFRTALAAYRTETRKSAA